MSRQESPTQTTGAHRRHKSTGIGRPAVRDDRSVRHRAAVQRPQGTLPMVPPAHYEPYLDGLFTYCLSVLCEHDAAAGALGEVLALAERQRARLRDPALRRPWLYALARWCCLRRLAAGTPVAPPRAAADVASQRAAQLAALAWPEAAGTSPEQREALELAVRHQLAPHEVAAVLGLDADAARGLLARAACEVERTRAALAVVDSGRCGALAQLAGDNAVLLGQALRDELVRHVDECTVCRRTAERAVSAGSWPGAADATAVLALIEAPRAAACAALLHAMETGVGRGREGTPRFDRRGFPRDLKDQAARRAQLRHRAVTTTVVAAVVAAPVLAVWAAYRATPLGADEAPGGRRAAAGVPDESGLPYEKAGAARPRASTPPGARSAAPGAPGAVDAEVTAVTVTASDAPPPAPGEGYLTVTAAPSAGRTVVTLTASGGDVHWAARTSAGWLRLSASSGVLHAGETATVTISVIHRAAPRHSWTAQVSFTPANATVILRGSSRRSVPPPASPPPPTSAPPTSESPPPSTAPPSDPPPSSDPPTTEPTGTAPPESTPAAG